MAHGAMVRTCIGCRAIKHKCELIRIVRNEESVRIDSFGGTNGRGAYVCRDRQCLLRAKKVKGLERAFKMSISDDVYKTLEEELGIGES